METGIEIDFFESTEIDGRYLVFLPETRNSKIVGTMINSHGEWEFRPRRAVYPRSGEPLTREILAAWEKTEAFKADPS